MTEKAHADIQYCTDTKVCAHNNDDMILQLGLFILAYLDKVKEIMFAYPLKLAL